MEWLKIKSLWPHQHKRLYMINYTHNRHPLVLKRYNNAFNKYYFGSHELNNANDTRILFHNRISLNDLFDFDKQFPGICLCIADHFTVETMQLVWITLSTCYV